MSRAEVEAEQDNVEVRCISACTVLSCLAAALLGQVQLTTAVASHVLRSRMYTVASE